MKTIRIKSYVEVDNTALFISFWDFDLLSCWYTKKLGS